MSTNRTPALLKGLIETKPGFDIDTVNECIKVLQKRFMGDLNREDMEVRRCIEDIKNHFGVKNDIT